MNTNASGQYNRGITSIGELGQLFLRLWDFLVIFGFAAFAFWFRFDIFPPTTQYQIITLIYALVFSLTALSLGTYEPWRGKQYSSVSQRLLGSWLVTLFIMLAVLVFSKQAEHVSRQWLAWIIIGPLFASLVMRGILFWLIRFVRQYGSNHKRTLIIGTGITAEKLINTNKEDLTLGLDIIGIYTESTETTADTLYETPLLTAKDISDLAKYVDDKNIEEICICLSLKDGDLLNNLLYELRNSTADIRFIPDMSDLRLLNHETYTFANMQVINLSCSPLNGSKRIIKATEDRVLGLIIFIGLLPILAIISIGVKISSPGPVLFKQQRHGVGGKVINVYKFRSMKTHSEDGESITQATKDDDRTTPFGSFLRRSSLDELPQFFNVLQGKMSIVGPRPHALVHNDHYKELIESYMRRHKVKPGITGWAQVNRLRGETDTVEKMQQRVEYDLYYIENWSLWLDIKIILKTIGKIFYDKNAY